jgi:hypothetical protein
MMFPATSTSIHATIATTPKPAFWAPVSFRSDASYQMIELTTAAAKGARINNFICDRSSDDPGLPGDAVHRRRDRYAEAWPARAIQPNDVYAERWCPYSQMWKGITKGREKNSGIQLKYVAIRDR